MSFGIPEDENYTHEDLLKDLEVLRKAGLIEVSGITDTGEWLYSMSEFGTEAYKEIQSMSSDMLEGLIRDLLDKAEDEDNL